jgi:ribosome modulation factor
VRKSRFECKRDGLEEKETKRTADCAEEGRSRDNKKFQSECTFKRHFRGWRDGSVVKSADCSPDGPEFKSQQPHGGSQPSVMKSDALFWSI